MSLFETGVRPAVDQWLLDEAAKIRDYGEYWSGSSAGYCMRKVIFDRLGVDPVNADARKQRVFTSGHLFHDWMQGITKQAGLSIMSEGELIDPELMIKGHFDDIVAINHNLILYDYKTVNSQSFKYKKDTMSHYHQMQLGTYIYMLRKGIKPINENGDAVQLVGIEALKEGRILNISKDDLRMGEQQLFFTPELEKRVFEYWTTLNGYWRDKKIPSCTCAKFEINPRTGKGFMADPRYNPYYYNNEPCSLAWYEQWKARQKEVTNEQSIQ